MTITVPLEPQAEAKLIALAQEKGVTADEWVRTAVQKIIAAEAAAKELSHGKAQR